MLCEAKHDASPLRPTCKITTFHFPGVSHQCRKWLMKSMVHTSSFARSTWAAQLNLSATLGSCLHNFLQFRIHRRVFTVVLSPVFRGNVGHIQCHIQSSLFRRMISQVICDYRRAVNAGESLETAEAVFTAAHRQNSWWSDRGAGSRFVVCVIFGLVTVNTESIDGSACFDLLHLA